MRGLFLSLPDHHGILLTREKLEGRPPQSLLGVKHLNLFTQVFPFASSRGPRIRAPSPINSRTCSPCESVVGLGMAAIRNFRASTHQPPGKSRYWDAYPRPKPQLAT